VPNLISLIPEPAVALLKIRCPECNAPLKSSTGFTVGEAVSCPKCETDFTVREPEEEPEGTEPKSAAGKNKDAPAVTKPRKGTDAEDDEDEDERPVRRSYKNSPLRYAVLGVLVVIMLVLAYMLYEKRKKEREADAADNSPGSSEPSTPRGPIGPVPPGGPNPVLPRMPVGIGGPKLPQPKDAAQALTEAKARLIGAWECRLGGGDVCSVEYKTDGTFTYTATPKDEPAKTITGRWTLERVEQLTVPEMGPQTFLFMEWVIDKQPPLKDSAVLRPDQKLQHPLLERIKPGTNPSSVFDRK